MQVHLYLKQENGTQVWGIYGRTKGWWWPDDRVTIIPLTVFEAKRIQQKTTSNYTTFWIEKIQE